MVALLFGPKWHAVAPIFALLAIGGIFRSISQISYWIFLSRGKTGAQFKQYLVTRPAMIAIILGGLPWGPIGVAVGCSIAYFLDWAVSLWWVGRATGVDSRALFRNAFRSLFLVSVPCGLVAFVGTLLTKNSVAELAIAAVLGAAYIAVLISVSPTVRSDAQMILYFVKRSIGMKPKPRHRATSVGVRAQVNLLLPPKVNGTPKNDRRLRHVGSHGAPLMPKLRPARSAIVEPRSLPTRASRLPRSTRSTLRRARRASRATRDAGQ
jgi:hypothetical protein